MKNKIKSKKLGCEKRSGIGPKIIELLAVTLSAQIMMLPFMIYHFGKISLTFWIANLLASPLLGVTILLGLITLFLSFIFLPIASISAFILMYLLKLFLVVARLTSLLPFSKVYVPIPPFSIFILYYFFLLWCVFTQKRAKEKREFLKKSLYIVSIFVVIGKVITYIPKEFIIHFIDVGQGDCCLIQTPYGKNILIDGGGSKEYDIGKSILLPYLLHRRIIHIDMAIISHFDEDHCQGLFTVMKELKVKNVIIGKQFEACENYEELKKIVKNKKIKVRVVEAGQRIKIEKELYFDVLWPSSDNVINENSINNNSLVCKMVYKDFSMLFTGDIEEIAEKVILEKYKGTKVLQSTILKVAHHGSKSSSIEKFLDAVKPKIALIGVGEKNTFGHPSQGVLERLENIRL